MFSCITYQLCVRPMLATAERGVAFSLRTLRLPKIPEVVASATALQIVRKSKASKTLTMELLHSPVPASHVLEWQLQRLLRIVLSLPGKPPNGPHAFRNICKPHSKIAECVHCQLCHIATHIASQKIVGQLLSGMAGPEADTQVLVHSALVTSPSLTGARNFSKSPLCSSKPQHTACWRNHQESVLVLCPPHSAICICPEKHVSLGLGLEGFTYRT